MDGGSNESPDASDDEIIRWSENIYWTKKILEFIFRKTCLSLSRNSTQQKFLIVSKKKYASQKFATREKSRTKRAQG